VKIILFLFIPLIIYSQSFEAVSVAHSVISGYATYHLSMDRELKADGNRDYIKHNKAWHRLQNVELGLTISAGALLVYNNYDEKKIDWLGIVKDVLIFSSSRWVIRDGVYNSLNGDSFFHQSNNTTAILEPIGSPYLKLGFLLFAILFKYVLF